MNLTEFSMMLSVLVAEEEKDRNRDVNGLATKKERTKQMEVNMIPQSVICFSAFLTKSIFLAPYR